LIGGGLGIALLAATSFFTPGVVVAQGKATVYKSPQEVFEAWKQALKKNDTAAVLRCTPGIDYMAVNSTIGAFMDIGMKRIAGGDKKEAEAKTKQLKALMAKHGLTEAHWKKLGEDKELIAKVSRPGTDPDDPAFKKLMEPVKDRAAYLVDLMKFMEGKEGKPGLQEEGKLLEKARLVDVKIDGDKAKGTVIVNVKGKEIRAPFEFRKEDGSWKIQPFPNQRPPKKGLPPDQDKKEARLAPDREIQRFTPDPAAVWSCEPGYNPHKRHE